MWKAFAAIAVAYLVAFWVAVVVGSNAPYEHPIAVAFVADVAATLAIFVFSFLFRNSSFYDAYWSVAPFAIGVYWMARAKSIGVDPTRQQLVLLLVAAWGARLTWNWARGWTGLGHEDWRYGMLAERTGRFYWVVSLAGIHMMPTVWVFLGCLPLYPALSVGVAPLGALDAVAFVVTASAIAIESVADKQLLRFRRAGPSADAVLDTGLWSWSRHPNYFGEMLFWWGLFLFGIAAAPHWWWTGVGALSITLMFRFVSLPMIETRMLERRPAFAAYQERVSLVVPWPP
jgi:steroid 5-alpha reductase family enzyme